MSLRSITLFLFLSHHTATTATSTKPFSVSTLPLYKFQDSDDLPEETAVNEILKEDLHNVLNTLNERERGILRMRYGLTADGVPKTLDEIGRHYEVRRRGTFLCSGFVAS
jgi:DNA-directed RNA polymerase specialized sigma subunit